MAWAIYAEGKIKPWSCGDNAKDVRDLHAGCWEDSKLIRVRIVPVVRKTKRRPK